VPAPAAARDAPRVAAAPLTRPAEPPRLRPGGIDGDPARADPNVRPGDAVLVSGPIGDHGVAIMLARGELDLAADLASDTAPLAGLAGTLLDAAPGARCLRDAPRGGVATVLNEIARAAGVAVVLDERAVPVREEPPGLVLLKTQFGGTRIVDVLVGDPLPRIC